MNKIFNNFCFSKYVFHLRVIDKIILPKYKGSALRGGFGYVFKKVACMSRGKECNKCILKTRCAYSYVFETPPPTDSKILRKYPNVPHPFVIEPPFEEKEIYDMGEIIKFNLILIGKAIEYIPYFVYTFDELGNVGLGKERGKYVIEKLENIIVDNYGDLKEYKIYDGDNKILLDKNYKFNYSYFEEKLKGSFPVKMVDLKFLSPIRIKYEGNITSRLEFHILLRNMLRRLSALSYFHCNEQLDIDYREIIDKAKSIKTEKQDIEWYDWKRYSTRQESEMSLGGFIGNVTFSGDLEEFLPFIVLCSHVHVGKACTFGLGKYEVDYE